LDRSGFDASDVLDEYDLHEAIRFAIVFVVVALADLADLSQLSVAECAAAIAEGPECVFRLVRHDDVACQAKEVALTCCVGQIARLAEYRAHEFLAVAHFASESCLIILEHALMFAHSRDMAAAEIPEAAVVRLLLVIFKRFDKRLVLHYRIVDLAFEKINSAFHCPSPLKIMEKKSHITGH
jgi:hypothetical protein